MIPRDRMKIKKPPSIEQQKEMAKTYISIFSDGSHCPNTNAYGYGFWVKYGYPSFVYTGGDGGVGLKSANEVEILGARKAVEFVKDLDLTGKIIVMAIDNLHAADVMNVEIKQLLKLGAANAYVKHVKGHKSGYSPRHSVNSICDSIARKFMLEHRVKVQLTREQNGT